MTIADHLDYRSNKKLHSLFLKHSIRLCYEKRWVTEWLFNDLPSSVIRTDFIIPPDGFSRRCFSTISASISTPNANQIGNTTIGNIAYMPVSHSDDVTIGYAFGFAFLSESQKYGIVLKPNLPFDVPFISRFAYDHREHGNLVFTTTGGNPKQIGISSEFYGVTDGSEGSFIVPAKEYTWDDLPQHPSTVFVGTPNLFGSLCSEALKMEMSSQEKLRRDPGNIYSPENFTPEIYIQDNSLWMNSKSVFSVSSGVHDSKLFQSEELYDSSYQHDSFISSSASVLSSRDIDPYLDVLNLIDSSFTSNVDVIKLSKESHPTWEAAQESGSNTVNVFRKINYTPLVISHNGHVADQASLSEAKDYTNTASGMFNMNLMNESIHELENSLSSKLFPYPEWLGHDPEPGYQSGIQFDFNPADELIRNSLQDTCMKVYYEVVLTIDTAHNFFTTAPMKEFKKIAPRPDNMLIASSANNNFKRKKTDDCECGSIECPCLIARRTHKAKIKEERRRRNRLSAIRSNERRRVKLLAARKELSESKNYIEKLKEKEKQIMRTNKELKRQLARTRSQE